MGRSPCCAKEGLNRGAWTASEDKILTDYVKLHGEGSWRNLPKKAGLKRCGKSCRLRWLNYLRPDIKRGNISVDEEELIIRLHKLLGNRWSLIAGRLPGRTDNEIKNYWNTNLCKKIADHDCSNKSKNKRKKNLSIPNMEINKSQVVRTRAMRCTKAFISPQLQKIVTADDKGLPKHTTSSFVKPMDQSLPSPISIPQANNPSTSPPDDNLVLDVTMEDVFLSDILNLDFEAHFNWGGYKCDDFSSAAPDGTLICSKDTMEDWTVNNLLQPNGCWLAEGTTVVKV